MSKCQFCKQKLEKKLLECRDCTNFIDLDDGFVCYEQEHFCDEKCFLTNLEVMGELCLEAYPDE